MSLVVVLVAAGWILTNSTVDRIQSLATTKIDNLQWLTAQTEVEALEFQISVSAGLSGVEPDLQEIRRRFDILYSRVDILESSANFASLREQPDVIQPLAEVSDFIANTVPLIDGSDAALIASLQKIRAESLELRQNIRNIALLSIRHFAKEAELQREEGINGLKSLGIFAGAAFLCLIFFLIRLTQTSRKSIKMTADLQRAERRQQSIIGTSIDAIIVVDRLGQVIEFNGAAEGIFGYSPEEAIGSPMAELIVPENLRERHFRGMDRYLATGEKRYVLKGRVQVEAMHKSGKVFPVELNVSTVDIEDGEVFIAYIRDISSWVEVKEELVDARDKAVAGERAKADLLAVMSHEIRTPLNGILGTLDLLGRTPLNEVQRKYTNIMNASGKMLTEHVNNVLDISRADAGKLEMAVRPFDPLALVNEVIDTQRESAMQRGNTISASVVGQPIGWAAGDPSRLRQVLVNIIGNAIKFTSDGAITVEIERAKSGNTIIFRISDTGVGIAKEDIGLIFGDFVTLDTSFDREVEGTGLGLGIVQRLVDVMKGQISVESELGVGSTFTIEMELPSASPISPTVGTNDDDPTEPVHQHELSVLVVEDNEINRMVVREMLASLGCEVTEALDGGEGVELANAQLFDLILMDISMPILDGVAATTRIREGSGPNAQTPIYALTAHTLPEDIQRFRSVGMTNVLTKPINMVSLKNAISDAELESGIEPVNPPITDEPMQSAEKTLVETLGEEESRRVTARANSEFADGLDEILELGRLQADESKIADIAHKLAGLAAIVGYDELRELLHEIEIQAKSGDRTDYTEIVDLARGTLS